MPQSEMTEDFGTPNCVRLFGFLFPPFHIAEAWRAQFYVKAAGSKAAREALASATSSQILPRREHLLEIF